MHSKCTEHKTYAKAKLDCYNNIKLFVCSILMIYVSSGNIPVIYYAEVG